jgi:hypothetical protein
MVKAGQALCLVVMAALAADQVTAANVRLVDQGKQVIVSFDGDIVIGDKDRFERVAEQGLALGKPKPDASRYLKLVSQQWDDALGRLKSFVESPPNRQLQPKPVSKSRVRHSGKQR